MFNELHLYIAKINIQQLFHLLTWAIEASLKRKFRQVKNQLKNGTAVLVFDDHKVNDSDGIWFCEIDKNTA